MQLGLSLLLIAICCWIDGWHLHVAVSLMFIYIVGRVDQSKGA